jgi:hypothetical protein
MVRVRCAIMLKYLSSVHDPDMDFVDGQIEERNWGGEVAAKSCPASRHRQLVCDYRDTYQDFAHSVSSAGCVRLRA